MALAKERKLYKIGHLTRLLGVTSRTIRYYDQFGLLPHVKRSNGNVRLFDDEDVSIIQKIRKLQKDHYLPLDVIRIRLFGEATTQPLAISLVYDWTHESKLEGFPHGIPTAIQDSSPLGQSFLSTLS